jgi:transcriptional regulator with XRE-family HTH domain
LTEQATHITSEIRELIRRRAQGLIGDEEFLGERASMPDHKLHNYVSAHRKRAGLTQREVASVLGVKARGPVSELEERHRVPLLRTALAQEAIFGVAPGELFAGIRESVVSDTQARLEKLANNFLHSPDFHRGMAVMGACRAVGRGLADARAQGKTLLRLRVVLDEGGWALAPGVAAGSSPDPTPDRLQRMVTLAVECGLLEVTFE